MCVANHLAAPAAMLAVLARKNFFAFHSAFVRGITAACASERAGA
jgi:hypothetical protein